MSMIYLLLPVLVSVVSAAIVFLTPRRVKWATETCAFICSSVFLLITCRLFASPDASFSMPWLMPGMEFSLKLYGLNKFVLLWIGLFSFFVTCFSTIKVHNHPRVREYYLYLFLTSAFASGAVVADNFVLLVFFWEALLVTLYTFISLGGANAHKTALKGFVIVGLCDFCLILGIGIVWLLTGTLSMSAPSIVPHGIAAVAFFLMVTGALGKGGAMPFHTWIPDAAIDAPVGFMAFLPASIEKLLGIYLLARISLDFFTLSPNDVFGMTLMTIGGLTIVGAVSMALVQKDLKRLLAYHAVSQVGYMVLGIGTGTPIGIIGGLFHMLNNAIYKSGLFLSAGSVEYRTGTTNLEQLGGIGKQMPVTAACFMVCAAAISGVWPFNGFVSKEMIYHGALETGYRIFAVAAWVGSILTFASFLKAGHSVFFGVRENTSARVKESETPILMPIIALSFFSILFGIYNYLPINLFFAPVIEGHQFGTAHTAVGGSLNLFNPVAGVSLLCLVAGFLLHYYGWKKGGRKAFLASEPVHNLPVLKSIYNWAERRFLDIYEQGARFLNSMAFVLYKDFDRPTDYLYEGITVNAGKRFTRVLQAAHNGHYANYLGWCIAGLLLIVCLVMLS